MTDLELRLTRRVLVGMLRENDEPGNTRRGTLGPIEIEAIENAIRLIDERLQPEPARIGGRCVG